MTTEIVTIESKIHTIESLRSQIQKDTERLNLLVEELRETCGISPAMMSGTIIRKAKGKVNIMRYQHHKKLEKEINAVNLL